MTCDNCYDTGHGNRGLSPYLDCHKCEVATIRARLNDQFPLAAKLYPDSLWGAYNEGVLAQQAAPAIPEGWQPIETAPKDGTYIMLTNGVNVAQGWWEHQEPCIRENRDTMGNYIDQQEDDGFDDWLDCEGGMQQSPTHWMPLPPAPEGEKK
jgi:hypothetical protein